MIACEASGDQHGAHLVEKLKQQKPDCEFRGLGGPLMATMGVSLIQDMTKISVLGFGDVLRNYFKFRKILFAALEETLHWKPDAIILIDSPAFNLRFAKKIHKRFPVIYYISPQLWAWGKRRIHTVKKTVSKMLTILPFEVDLYRKAGIPCEFVGHPLLDQVRVSADREILRNQFEIPEDKIAVALQPGSRKSEVQRILPLMLEAAIRLKQIRPDTTFFLTQSSNVSEQVYEDILKNVPLGIHRIDTSSHDLTAAMDFALITSGTATLEATLIGTPYFLLYKASWSTYILGRLLIQVSYLGMANLLAGKRIVPEFIQQDIQPEKIARQAAALLENREAYDEMKKELLAIRTKLGEKGASSRAAAAVLDFLKTPSASATLPVKG